MIKILGSHNLFIHFHNKHLTCFLVIIVFLLTSCIPKENDNTKKAKAEKFEDVVLEPGEDGYRFVNWDAYNNPYQDNDYINGKQNLSYYLTELSFINARNVNFAINASPGQNCEQWIESQPEEVEVLDTRVIVGTRGVALPQNDHCLYQETFNNQVSCVYLPRDHDENLDYRTPVSFCEDDYGQYTFNFQILPVSHDFNMYSSVNWVATCDDLYDFTSCDIDQTHIERFLIQKNALIATAYDYSIQGFVSDATYNYYALKIYEQSELSYKTFTASNFREDQYSFVVGDLKHMFNDHHERLPDADEENQMKDRFVNALPTQHELDRWIRDNFVGNSDCSEIEPVRCPETGTINGAWGHNYPICDYEGKFTNVYSECRLEYCEDPINVMTQYGECVNPYLEHNVDIGNIVNDPKQDIIDGVNQFHIDYGMPLMNSSDLEQMANQFMITISTMPPNEVLKEYRKVKVYENRSVIQSYFEDKFFIVHKTALQSYTPHKDLDDYPAHRAKLELEVISGRSKGEVNEIIRDQLYVPEYSTEGADGELIVVDLGDESSFECDEFEYESRSCTVNDSGTDRPGRESRHCQPNRTWSGWQTCYVSQCPAGMQISFDELSCETVQNSNPDNSTGTNGSPDQGDSDVIQGGISIGDAGNSADGATQITLIASGSTTVVNGSLGFSGDNKDYYKVDSPGVAGLLSISLDNMTGSAGNLDLKLLQGPFGVPVLISSTQSDTNSEVISNQVIGHGNSFLIEVTPAYSSQFSSYTLTIDFSPISTDGGDDSGTVGGDGGGTIGSVPTVVESTTQDDDFSDMSDPAVVNFGIGTQYKVVGGLVYNDSNGGNDSDAFRLEIPASLTGYWKVVASVRKVNESEAGLEYTAGFTNSIPIWGAAQTTAASNAIIMESAFKANTSAYFNVLSYGHTSGNSIDYEIDFTLVEISALTARNDSVNGSEISGLDASDSIIDALSSGFDLSSYFDDGNTQQTVSIAGSTGLGGDVNDVYRFTTQKSGTLEISISGLVENTELSASGNLYIEYIHGDGDAGKNSHMDDRGQDKTYSEQIMAGQTIAVVVNPYSGAYSVYDLQLVFTPDSEEPAQ